MAIGPESTFTMVITGGGTGGHLFPGIAVAQEVMARLPKAKVVFLGTERAVDQNAMSQYGYESRAVRCGSLKGGSWGARLRTIVGLPGSIWQAWKMLREFRPDLVLGVGGYVTGPVIVAAKMLGITTAIHEQNSIPGLANRQLGGIVDRVFVSIPGSERHFPKQRCLLSGNPLRQEILGLARRQESGTGATVLVLGGSQGAHRLNMLMTEAIANMGTLPPNFSIIHQTGRADEEMVHSEYQRLGVKAEVKAFFTDMVAIYRQADLVVSRAGATTLAELTALGKPSILVPFPFAADDHQTKNAEALVKAGAARMFPEEGLTATVLGRELLEILGDAAKRTTMGQAAHSLARLDAVSTIVDACLGMVSAKK